MASRLRKTTLPADWRWYSCWLPAFLCAVFLFALGSSVSLFAQDHSPSHPEPLRGTVLNALTHEPIGHALVLSTDNRFATMTDDQGRFEFAALEPKGSFTHGPLPDASLLRPQWLMARKPGFLPENEFEPNVSLSPGQTTVTINLVPEALIIGRVVLPVSDYLSRTQVQLYRHSKRDGREHWDNVRNVRSRADGSFRFAGLSQGEYKLITEESLDRDPLTFDPGGQLFGYPPVYFPSAPDFSAAQTIRLPVGATFQANLSPVRREYYAVKIGVTNPSSNFQVEVWPQGRPSPGYSLAFVPQDSAIEGSLPEGTYTIHAFNYGAPSVSGTARITVSSGGPSNTAPMTLLPNPSITVNVRDEFQNPHQWNQFFTVQGADGPRQFNASPRRPSYLHLQLIPTEAIAALPYAGLRQPTGPEDDSLVIDNVRPGKYRVQATTAVGYIASISLGGVDLLHAPLQVEAGSAMPPMEIHVRDDGADVQGRVDVGANRESSSVGLGNVAAQSPIVYFLPAADSTGQFRMVWAPATGEFQQQQLAPGTYRVLTLDHQDPELQYATDEALAQYDSKMQIIEVAAGQKVKLQLSLIHRTP